MFRAADLQQPIRAARHSYVVDRVDVSRLTSHIRIRRRGTVLLLVAASFWPLYVMAANPVSIARPERIAAIIAIVFVLGQVFVHLLSALGMHLEPAENTSFLVVVLLMSAGPLLRELGAAAVPLLLIMPILAGWLFSRLEGQIIVAALVWGTAVAVSAGPLAALVDSLQSQGPSAVVEARDVTAELVETPDIFLVVFDGYPGAIASDQDGLEPGDVDVVNDLRNRGFEVPESSWSTYWTTTLSIPSLLEMRYVVEREWIGLATVTDLQRTVAGDNTLVDILTANGYRTHMVESGWSGGSCGAGFARCVPAPWVDEATYLTLEQTIAWAVLDTSPGPSIEGTLAAFDWLASNGTDLSRSSQPNFVFAHVVAPHPPLYLTPDCSLALDPSRGGTFFSLPGVSDQSRAEYLVEQMDCMDTFMLSFADLIDPDDVVIYVSDHGTDRRKQNDPEYIDWDQEAIVERMNNFLALRLPEGCTLGDEVVVPNVFRGVLSCISDTPIEPLPERIWVNPMRELEPGFVTDLLAGRADQTASP